jgi:Protein of unknown function (DUF4240)
MDVAQFWSIVESSKKEAVGNFDSYVESLAEQLSALSPEAIVAFQGILDELRNEACSWDLWGVAYIIGGGCSDDAFADFRSWLVSMGRETYTRTLNDPESLADIVVGPDGEEDVFFEEFAYIPARVYEAKTGQPLPYAKTAMRSDPSGEEWDDDGEDLARRFPRLSSLYQGN